MARKLPKRRTAARARKRQAEGARKSLSIDALVDLVREGVEKIPDYRPPAAEISLPDALMSAIAMLPLKDPALLALDERRDDENLKTVYQRVRSHFVSRRIGQIRLYFSGFHRRRCNGSVCLQRSGLPRLTSLIAVSLSVAANN